MRGKVEKYLTKIKQRLFLRFNVVDFLTCKNSKSTEDVAFKNASKYDVILALGGDGTLHQVVNGVLKSGCDVVVGVLPYGTCNDVAKTLKMPKNLNKALDCILRLDTINYDVAFDGQDYMTYSLASGFLTKTSYQTSSKAKQKFGRFAYVIYAIKNMFKCKGLPLTISADGERFNGKFNFIMLLNSEYAGGFKLNKNENLQNKKIKLVLIKQSKFLWLLAFIKLFMFGINSVRKSKQVIVKDVHQVEIVNHSNTPFTFDGEKAKFLKKNFKVIKSVKIIKN